jgi:hypothetical protein
VRKEAEKIEPEKAVKRQKRVMKIYAVYLASPVECAKLGYLLASRYLIIMKSLTGCKTQRIGWLITRRQ